MRALLPLRPSSKVSRESKVANPRNPNPIMSPNTTHIGCSIAWSEGKVTLEKSWIVICLVLVLGAA